MDARPTPRTDFACFYVGARSADCVDADFARQLERSNAELAEALAALVKRIEHNGGIGEYNGGPVFVMARARTALRNAGIET